MTTSDINQIQGSSPDLKTELARQFQELVPEAITDGRVDLAKFRELLADDAGVKGEQFGLFCPGKRRAMRAAWELSNSGDTNTVVTAVVW
jgi:adenine-specific DNA-methyltransferase